jgi:hypothetical protein
MVELTVSDGINVVLAIHPGCLEASQGGCNLKKYEILLLENNLLLYCYSLLQAYMTK